MGRTLALLQRLAASFRSGRSKSGLRSSAALRAANRRWPLASAAALAAAILAGGCATQIAGRVSLLDESGAPLPVEEAEPQESFVNIIGTTATIDQASQSAPVAPDGSFVKKDLAPGVYKVEVSRPGFVTVTQQGELKKFRSLKVDARLTRIPEGERRSLAESSAEEDKIVDRGDVSIAPPPF